MAIGAGLLIALATAMGGVIGREGVLALTSPSPQATERHLFEALSKARQQIKAMLPRKSDDGTTMVDMTFSGRVVNYFYVLDEKRNNFDPDLIRSEVIKRTCAEGEMVKAMKQGISYRYTYEDTTGKRVTSFELGNEQCTRS